MEKDLSNCRKCGQIKTRILKGKFDDKNKKYVDEKDRLWNGRTCPDCHGDNVRERMAKLRLMRKSEEQS